MKASAVVKESRFTDYDWIDRDDAVAAIAALGPSSEGQPS